MHVPDEPARQLLATLTARFKRSGRVLSFPEWEAERDRSRPLSGDEMRQAIDVAIAILDDLYVHIDLKRTRRGIDPVRQLRVFRERAVLDAGISSRMFHRTMLEIFKSLGDVHTAYRLPDPYTRAIAFLPFLMCAYGPPDRETYIGSHSLMSATDEARALALEPGAEILTWNGVRIDEAVRRSTEFEEGSNLPHDLALGLQAMTIRWLAASYEPDSPWVLVGYTGTDGTYRETKCYWSVLLFRKDPKLATSVKGVLELMTPSRPHESIKWMIGRLDSPAVLRVAVDTSTVRAREGSTSPRRFLNRSRGRRTHGRCAAVVPTITDP